MDIYQLIKKDHDAIRQVISQIDRARSPERRAALAFGLSHMIQMHGRTEAKVWYVALESFPELRAWTEAAREEHEELEDLVGQITRLAGSRDFMGDFAVIRQELTDHMRDEEDKIFPLSQDRLAPAQARRLGMEMKMLQDDYISENLLSTGGWRDHGGPSSFRH